MHSDIKNAARPSLCFLLPVMQGVSKSKEDLEALLLD